VHLRHPRGNAEARLPLDLSNNQTQTRSTLKKKKQKKKEGAKTWCMEGGGGVANFGL
jgi:hypothetical protein